jgi:malate synthase
MKVARRKKSWAAAARQAAARKTKRKISKARQASRNAVPKARRGAARKRKRATPRKAAPKAKPKTKAAVLAAVAGVVVRGRMGPRYADILTRDALAFLAELHRRFDGERRALLAARAERQKRFDAGELPDFPRETKHIRDDDSWRVAPVPADLNDRRVEITGPVDRKMIVNALNSGANLGEQSRGPNQSEGPLGGQDRLHRSANQEALRRRTESRGADRTAAWLAPARGAPDG